MTTRQIPRPGDRITRQVHIDRRAIDVESRTVELAFASEAPVERWYGYEVLRCDAAAIRLGRINNAGAFLCNHDWDCQIGVIERAQAAGPEGKCRATVRFSRSSEAEEYFQDVVDGIRQHISVGYIIHAVEDRTEANVTTYTVTDWEPYEISLVSVPADISVGIGRSLQPPTPEQPMTAPTETTETRSPAPVVDITSLENQARAAERERVSRLLKIGERYGAIDDARAYVEAGRSVDEFMDHLVRLDDRAPAKPLADLDMPAREQQQYSVLRACYAYLTRDWSKAGLELEASRTIADKLGREARGFFVPSDLRMPMPAAKRAMIVGDDTAGGYLVQESSLGLFIEALRAQSVLMGLGATVLDGLSGDVAIPRVNTSAQFYWVSEDEDGTDSEPAIGSVTLRPRTVAGAVPITRKLLQQTSGAVEMMVRMDMVRGAALAIDKAGIQGSGVAGQPLGFINQTGIKTQAISSDSAPTWAEVVGLESAIATADALLGNLAYLMTPALRGALKTTTKDTGSGMMVWADDNTVNGYRAVASTQCPSNGLYFANWSDMLMGFWGVLDVKPDEATKAASGGLVLRVFQDADVAVRHPESFCKGT